MAKKFLSIILVGLMIFSLLPTTFAQDVSVDEIYNEFSEYFVKEKRFESITQSTGLSRYDNVRSVTTDLPFVARAYFKNIDSEGNPITPAKDTPVIFYVINHGEEVIGTESNISIVNDMLDDGYIVFTLDYLNNPKAVSPEIDWSLLGARTQIMEKINDYFSQISYTYAKEDYAYIVPEGCRIERDIWYFNLIENGSVLTEQRILESWNSDGFINKAPKIPAVAQNNYQKGVWYEAETLEDCVRPDGSPIDLDLRLDIIYPSQPKSKPPVFALASSSEMRNGATGHASRPHFIGFLMRGYAGACYDHEYIPMARTDHYGYYAIHSTAKINGVKTHTAAIRCIRQYADDFGYDESKIGSWGHSKSSYSGLLGRENPELLPEITPSEVNGPQPNLTYDHNGETIPSNVQCVYTSMGDGTKLHETLVNETTAPSIPACGQKDQYGAYTYWSSMLETYKNNDIVTLAMDMPDLGHEYPYAIDPILNYDRYSATLDFFDYHLKGNIGAKAVYAYPKDDNQEISISDSVYVKFNAPISKEEIEKNVKIIDASSGKSISGSWSSLYGGTQWTFTTDLFENAHVYNLVVPTTIKGNNGLNLSEGWFTKFVTKGGEKLFPSKDAYINSASLTNTGSEKTIEISAGSKKGYIEFDLSKLQSGSLTSSLQFTVENNATQNLLIYGLKDNAPSWEENTINWDNAPANVEGNLFDEEYATLIDRILVNSSGIFTIDVTSYIDSLSGDKARFVISSVSKPGEETLNIQFDDLASTGRNTETTIVNECHSDKYLFRADSSKTKLSLSTEYDVNGNGQSLFFDRSNKYDRILFYNMLKTSALTEDDIGKTFESSVWVYPLADMKIQVGLMNHSEKLSNGSRLYSHTQKAITAGSWHEIKFTCAIDENVVNEQIGMLCIRTNGGTDDFYIDNIVVKEIATDVTITSKEGRDFENQKFMPTLILEKGDKITSTSNDATYIKNGDDKDTIFNGGAKLYINGGETPIIADGNKKAYVKLPISDASTSKKVELTLDVAQGTNNLIYVYGVDGKDENLLADENEAASTIHGWEDEHLKWTNAPANDRTGNGVLLGSVYDGKEIAKVNVTTSGKYTVDITNYAKALATQGSEYATIILVAQRQNGTYGLVENFDAMNDENFTKDTTSATYCHSDKYVYRVNGTPGAISLTDTEDSNGDGKSVSVTRNNGSDGIKFYNTFKTTALDETDIGRTFNISFDVKPSKSTTILASVMNSSTLNDYNYTNTGYGTTKSQSVTANAWTTVSFDYKLDANNIAGQIGLLTIEDSDGANMFIDNIKVVEKGVTDVLLNSVDGASVIEKLGFHTTLTDVNTKNGNNTTNTTNTEYSSTYYYRTGGYAPKSKNTFTKDEDHTGDGGGSHVIGYVNPTSEKAGHLRAKFYNTVESDRSLTSDDIGRRFKVKFWAKSQSGGVNFKAGTMSCSGDEFVTEKIIYDVPSTWTQYEHEFTITEDMATAATNEQGTMFTVVRTPENIGGTYIYNNHLYIDDIEVYELFDSETCGNYIQFTAEDDTVKTKNALADSFVASGSNSNETYGTQPTLTVGMEDYKESILSGIAHTFIKIAKGAYENINSATLKINVTESANQTVKVYGLTENTSWAQNELKWSNANVLDGNDIDLTKVFGNEPLTTITVTDAKEYEIDVTEFVKANSDSDMTFILVADKKSGKKIINLNFDESMVLTEEHDYRKGGSPNFDSLRVTTNEHFGESGGALEMYDIKNTTGILKFLHFFQNAHFTSADKGRKFVVSGMIKAATTGRKYDSTQMTYTEYDSISTTNVRMGVMSNYHGTAGTTFVTGTQNNIELQAGVWTPFSFTVEVDDAMLSANGTVFAVDQMNAPDGIFATSLFIDNLIVEEIGSDLGTQVAIDNEANAPNVYIERPYIDELIDIDELSINLKNAISSGDFKEGDTIELRAEIKAPLEKIVKNVTFYNGDKEIVGKVYKDGYDYVIRMYNVEKGTYNVSALVKFEDGSIETTNEIAFTIKAGASYVVENTSYEGNITNGSTLKVTKTVRNNTASPKTAILVLATYDDSDNLITSAISTSEVTIANGEAKDITASITMPQAGEYTVKAFIWDSYKNALPLVNPVTITDLN